MHRYFVSFCYQGKNASSSTFSYGSTELATDEPIGSIEELNTLLAEKLAEEDYGPINVTPLAFQKFGV